MSSRIIQVGAFATRLRDIIESDELLQDIWVEGEISSFTVAGSGHAYFAIKDATAAVDCVMWKQTRLRQSFQPRVGDMVVIHGGAAVYVKTTRLQMMADVIYPAGAGILQLQLEQLRQKLEMEGLFDPSRKRPLPLFPKRIGVVTSPTGAVWHDIQRVLQRRYPLAELVLSATVVQGENAPDSIVAALRRLQDNDIDVVILARGGGSAEDLWAFNDERIARAIFASTIPVVSAIGHETDTSIADMVADLRAPTPSVAAEMVAPDLWGISIAINDITTRMASIVLSGIDRRQRDITNLQHRLSLMSPRAQLIAMRASLSAEMTRMQSAADRDMERRMHEVDRMAVMLRTLNPSSLFQRGYAHLTHSQTGAVIKEAAMLNTGEQIRATFADGVATATIKDVSISVANT